MEMHATLPVLLINLEMLTQDSVKIVTQVTYILNFNLYFGFFKFLFLF